jgi:hypothetical protein
MEPASHCNQDFFSVVADYKANGFAVVPSVLSPDEVQACRDGLHASLLEQGIDYANLQNAESLSRLRQFQAHQSGGLPFYYCDWQMQHCMGNLRLYEATKSIWEATWAKGMQGTSLRIVIVFVFAILLYCIFYFFQSCVCCLSIILLPSSPRPTC